MCHSVRECFYTPVPAFVGYSVCSAFMAVTHHYVPKKPNATHMKDFRPVALTSALCKCMEIIVHYQLTTAVAGRMDPLQFAYRAGRGWMMLP